jgi:hypothetical protein
MIKRSPHTSISKLIGCMFIVYTLSGTAMGQSIPIQAQPSNRHTQVSPVSLAHLYWHFLTLQNVIDTKATSLASQNKDGSQLRNALQRELGWSDADYAPVRTSSGRLTGEVKGLDAQAIAIRTAGASSSNQGQLKALTAQREADIAAEIFYLRQTLPPAKIKIFEAFLTQFFSPANGSLRPPTSTAGSSAPGAVQQ